MKHPTDAPIPGRRSVLNSAIAVISILLLSVLTACGGSSETDAGAKLAADAPLPDEIPEGTVLRLGMPNIEVALKASGLDKEIKGYKIEWANISGGPKGIEAFRAGALDASTAAEIPSLFATWTHTPVKIFSVNEHVDPLKHPTYSLGVAPGVEVKSIEDLKGKKIAYSPGQAQGALILKTLAKAGLTQDDVELIEMESVDDTYVNALGSKQVDIAPLGGTLLASYLEKYGDDGGTSIKTGIRDDAGVLWGPVETFEDAGKVAALKDFLTYYVRAEKWIKSHVDEYIQAYYVEHEGLSFEDGKVAYEASGETFIPEKWDDFITRHQETADLLSKEQGHPHIDVDDLYDRRFEPVIAEALKGVR